MRKLLLLATAAIVTVTSAMAAETESPYFGLRLGAGITALTYDAPQGADPDLKGGLAFNTGLYGLFNSGGFLSIGFQPEVLYVGEALSTETTIFNQTFKSTTTFSSVRVPLLVKLSLGDPDAIQPSVFAGPFANILLSGSTTNSVNGNETTESIPSDELETFGYGVAVGADVRLLRNLVVDLRYYFALSSYGKDDPLNTRMNSLMFNIGVMFN